MRAIVLNKYEVWSNFSIDKISSGCTRLVQKLNMNREVKEKQYELDINRLQTMLKLKEGEAGEKPQLERQIDQMQAEKMEFQRREQELKEDLLAWKELLDTKEEELDVMKEKYHNLKRQRDEHQALGAAPKNNIRKDHIIVEDTGKSATCSSNDCVIF